MDLRYARLKLELRLARRHRPTPSAAMVAEARDLFEAVGRLVGVPDGVVATPVDVDGVPGEWLLPDGADPDLIVLYLHGGAYVFGSINASRDTAVKCARAIGGRGLSIDYRLAPEHAFPAALDDALVAYRWLLMQGRSPARIVVAGDSAGGGLALALGVAIRDAGLPQPAALVATSAWADLALVGESYRTRSRRDLALDVPLLAYTARQYVPVGDLMDPLVSPVCADLTGLAPLVLLVGTEEVVFDDTATLADHARRDGVPVEVLIGDGMLHCWTGYTDRIRRASDDLAWMGDRVRQLVEHAGGGDRATA